MGPPPFPLRGPTGAGGRPSARAGRMSLRGLNWTIAILAGALFWLALLR